MQALLRAHWDSDGSSWLRARPGSDFFKGASLALGRAIALAARAGRRCAARRGEVGEGRVGLPIYVCVCVYNQNEHADLSVCDSYIFIYDARDKIQTSVSPQPGVKPAQQIVVLKTQLPSAA